MVPVDMEDRAQGEGGELGISLNMCFLGALVLLGLGILLFSGEYYRLGLRSVLWPCLDALSALTSPCFPEASPDCLHLQVRCWSRRLVSRRRPGFLSVLGVMRVVGGEALR